MTPRRAVSPVTPRFAAAPPGIPAVMPLPAAAVPVAARWRSTAYSAGVVAAWRLVSVVHDRLCARCRQHPAAA